MESVVDPNLTSRRAENCAFWQRFIDGAHFDHPDQPAPRHGGDNWVSTFLPGPIGWLTAFRSTGSKPESACSSGHEIREAKQSTRNFPPIWKP